MLVDKKNLRYVLKSIFLRKHDPISNQRNESKQNISEIQKIGISYKPIYLPYLPMNNGCSSNSQTVQYSDVKGRVYFFSPL